MSDFSKIEYHDLLWELRNNRLPACQGRTTEITRLLRILNKKTSPHALIVGPTGIGKTTLLYGLTNAIAATKSLGEATVVSLSVNSLYKIGGLGQAGITPYQEAFTHLHNSVVIIDDFGQLFSHPTATQGWITALQTITHKPNIRLVMSLTDEQMQWLEKTIPHFCSQFEIVSILEQPTDELVSIIKSALAKLSPQASQGTSTDSITAAIHFVKRFPKLGQLPKAAITLLDEALAESTATTALANNPTSTHPIIRHMHITQQKNSNPTITPETITKIVSEKLAVPLQTLNQDEKHMLRQLPDLLNSSIIGQPQAMSVISSIIQRAKLGLRSEKRPLASFLILGPSGVGKTETAKLLAHNLYGKKDDSFLRIDMSEFGEAHTVQRLTGAPPGYTGYDSGGQLTNHLKTTPYSLILLDEIEKAHPKIFDVFLQMLDDGRLTSGQGETVDATQSLIMATSNLCVDDILSFHNRGGDVHDPQFTKNSLIPILARHFRLEFLNRFDAIVIYNPLSQTALTDIALLEMKKIQQRVKQHNIAFTVSRETMEQKVAELYDPRFGARPIKRFVEDLCEGIITKQLLS